VHSGDSEAVGGVADPTGCAGLRVAEGADSKKGEEERASPGVVSGEACDIEWRRASAAAVPLRYSRVEEGEG
jgi:hypothetical protein